MEIAAAFPMTHEPVPMIPVRPPASMFRFLVICLLMALAVACSAETFHIGLVGRFREIPKVTVHSPGGLSVIDSEGKSIVSIPAAEQITLARGKSGIDLTRLDGSTSPVGEKIKIFPAAANSLITLSRSDGVAAQYRGQMLVTPEKQGLLLVNLIDIEEYLLSVVPSEMPSAFHLEALKAQAVAARTYSYTGKNRHEKGGFDLCDTVHCQAYNGVAAERTSTTQAVKETAGLVATYQGRLISALYCSDCGGSTQDGGHPYLVPVSDKPDGGATDHCDWRGHSWSKTWTLQEFETLLVKSFPKLKGLKSVSTTNTDSTGRVGEVKLESDSGETTLAATRLRSLLGTSVMRSTAFSVKIEDGNVIFDGKGFGHGVGLCQFGSNGLANEPNNYTFDRILKHYYRGIEVETARK